MSEVQIRPLWDRIVVKRTKAEEVSKGGIIIPDNAKEKPLEGTVVAIGCGKLLSTGKLQEPAVKVGEKVLFGKYTGTEIAAMSDHLIIREDDILAVLDE